MGMCAYIAHVCSSGCILILGLVASVGSSNGYVPVLSLVATGGRRGRTCLYLYWGHGGMGSGAIGRLFL